MVALVVFSVGKGPSPFRIDGGRKREKGPDHPQNLFFSIHIFFYFNAGPFPTLRVVGRREAGTVAVTMSSAAIVAGVEGEGASRIPRDCLLTSGAEPPCGCARVNSGRPFVVDTLAAQRF